MIIKKLLYIFIPFVLGISCKSRRFDQNNHVAQVRNQLPQVTLQSFTPEAHNAWQQYVARVRASGALQNPCQPTAFPAVLGADTRSAPKGLVILFHGFTACPQQFWEWGELLSKSGFDVLLPLLPGHGRPRPRVGSGASANTPKDDVSLLPDHINHKKIYDSFLNDMGSILKNARVPTLVGGLSFGGALAVALSQRYASFVNRVLIVTPLFEVADARARFVLGMTQNAERVGLQPLPAVLNYVQSWGPGCEDEISRNPPRGGYCEFFGKHVYANQLYASKIFEEVKPISASIQILGVQDDKAVNNQKLLDLALKLQSSSPPPFRVNLGTTPVDWAGLRHDHNSVRICFYEKGTNHSLFSRYDAPSETKFWLQSLLTHATRFAQRGEFFPTQAQSHNERACTWQN